MFLFLFMANHRAFTETKHQVRWSLHPQNLTIYDLVTLNKAPPRHDLLSIYVWRGVPHFSLRHALQFLLECICLLSQGKAV